PASGVRPLAREEGLLDPRRRGVRRAADAPQDRGHHGGHLFGHADRGCTALLPRADDAQARGHARVRQRQQVPLQGLQRLLDARPGLHQARDPRRPARPHHAAAQGARGRHRERGRDRDRGLPAHEALRRVAAPRAEGRQDRRHRHRGGHPAPGLRAAGPFPRAGHRGDGVQPRHPPPRRPGGEAEGDLRARHGGDRGRRRRVPGAHHAHRSAELAAAPGTDPKRQDGEMKFETKVIHAGQEPDPRTGAVMTPIYATSTYAQSSPGEHKGYDYARTRNPTRDALEACLAELEGGDAGFAFSSGMAAIGTLLETLDAGSHVVCMHDLYGGSYRILERVRKRSAGLQATFVDLSDAKALEPAIRSNTRMLWVETPTNPLLKLVDLSAVAEIAHRKNL